MYNKLFADSIERRDKLQLFADIIKVSTNETKITRILRLANIQYNTFHECIEILCESGLLEKVAFNDQRRSSQDIRSKHTYQATKMGKKWCEMVDEVYRTLEAAE